MATVVLLLVEGDKEVIPIKFAVVEVRRIVF